MRIGSGSRSGRNYVDVLFHKSHLSRCLAYVLPFRQYSNRLVAVVTLRIRNNASPFDHFYFNQLLKAIDATSIHFDFHALIGEEKRRVQYRMAWHLWTTCPFTREMREFTVPFIDDDNFPKRLPVPRVVPWNSCPNEIGFYYGASDELIRGTLDKIISGSSGIVFHSYYYHWRMNVTFPYDIIEWLFGNYDFEEFCTEVRHRRRRLDVNLWYGLIPGPTPYKIRIMMCPWWMSVVIGKAKTVDNMEKKYGYGWTAKIMDPTVEDKPAKPPVVWKMETAVEP